MARTIRMPSEDELPDGPRRYFVEELRRYYRAAGRPALRRISKAIEGRADLHEVTASQETVRRMLRGTVLPVDWNRVNAVFQVLCEMSNTDPDGIREMHQWGPRETNRERLHQLWDNALEEEPPVPLPAPAAPGFGVNGPFSDEPPF